MIRFNSALLAVAMLALTGCSVDPVDVTHNGVLEEGDSAHPRDQSFYDEYTFKAKEGWTINVTMTSAAFDTYVQLRQQGRGDEGLLENDDAVSGNPSAGSAITTTASTTGTYVVWAIWYTHGETGAYTVHITAQPPAGQ